MQQADHMPCSVFVQKNITPAQLANVTAMLDEMVRSSPDAHTRSPHLEIVRKRRERITSLRKQGHTWPEILPIIFRNDPPTLRTFKRLWAKVLDET
jgi:hypothetical protein